MRDLRKFDGIPVRGVVIFGEASMGRAAGMATVTLDSAGPGSYGLLIKDAELSPRYQEGEVLVAAPEYPFVGGRDYVVKLKSGRILIAAVSRTPDSYLLRQYDDRATVNEIEHSEVEYLHRIICTWH